MSLSQNHQPEKSAAANHPGGKNGSRCLQAAGVSALLVILVFLVFGQTLRFDFINYDDDLYVYENPLIAAGLTFQGTADVLTHYECDFYTPLTMISHMADCQFYGLTWPGGHHLTNVLLHAATSALLFLVLLQMTGALWRCAFVAAVFAVHPLHVESVAWVAERNDVLSGLFFALTIGAYVRYARKPGSLARYLPVAALFLAGLLSKPTLVTLPFVLLILDYWPLKRFAQNGGKENSVLQLRGLLMEKIPLLALSLAACVAAYFAEGKAVAPLQGFSLSSRVANALVSYVIYACQMIWPAGLAVFYPRPADGLPLWEAPCSAVVLACISAGVFAMRKSCPYLVAGWLWYLGMLVPMIGLVQVGEFAHADRYAYLSQIGLYLALAWGLADLCRSLLLPRVVPGIAAVLVTGALTVCSMIQASYWRDSESLFRHAIASTRDNHVACNNLGIVEFQKGHVQEAAGLFLEALRINPAYAEAHNNLGFALVAQGQTRDAINEYRDALRINPDFALAHNDLGIALWRQDDADGAETEFREAVRIKPDFADAHTNLGNVLLPQGRVEDAIREYQEALRVNPSYADAHFNLGLVLFQQGRAEEAIAHTQKALELRPDSVATQGTLAWMLSTAPQLSARNGAKAVQLATLANQSSGGNDPRTLRTLAAAYAEAGSFPDAVQTAKKALQLAESKSDTSLAAKLRREIELYKAGRRFE